MANEKAAEHIADTLRYVADNVERYLPQEWLLEGSTFVVRIPDLREMPTVELDGEMPAIVPARPKDESGTAGERS